MLRYSPTKLHHRGGTRMTQGEPIARGSEKLSMRMCAKCGSIMECFFCEQMFTRVVIPAGVEMHFRCQTCGMEITTRSAWRISLILFGFLLLFPFFWARYPFED